MESAFLHNIVQPMFVTKMDSRDHARGPGPALLSIWSSGEVSWWPASATSSWPLRLTTLVTAGMFAGLGIKLDRPKSWGNVAQL